MKEERIIVGWEKIHKEIFCDKDGRAVISLSTLRQTYGPDMKKVGAVFRVHIGRGKRPYVCGYPRVIRKYFAARQIKINQGINDED